jgi:hypothetical protein
MPWQTRRPAPEEHSPVFRTGVISRLFINNFALPNWKRWLCIGYRFDTMVFAAVFGK